MITRKLALVVALGCAAQACEDGPKQVFTPNTGDPTSQNGLDENSPFTQAGEQKYVIDDDARDDTGRARFCNVEDNDQLVKRMVLEPIIPNESIGGVPMWTPDNRPMHADELIGEGAFCDPAEYADGFVWGAEQEVVFLFDQETRLAVQELALTKYQGTLEGDFDGLKADGSMGKVNVRLKLRDRLKIEGMELDQYADQASAAGNPRSWVNPKNVTAVYRMVRQKFFGDAAFDESFDCTAANVCDVIFLQDRATRIDLSDSGLILVFTPDGYLTAASVFPVRIAPFERETAVVLGTEVNTLAPTFTSTSKDGCTLGLAEGLTFGDFVSRCIGDVNSPVLQRANFNVHAQRDGVDVEFNGATFSFMRDTTTQPVLKDGERPAASDSLYGMFWSRNLTAPLAEFRPRTIAQLFKQKLERRLREAVNVPAVGGGDVEPDAGVVVADLGLGADAGVAAADAAVAAADAAVAAADDAVAEADAASVPANTHPFARFELEIPAGLLTDEADEPRAIDQLVYTVRGADRDWIAEVVDQVRALYDSLSADERAALSPNVIEATWIVEPFTDALLEVFSHGQTNAAYASKRFYTTDDRRWSVGFANFVQDGVPYRLTVQFSINFDALTAIDVSTGLSAIDRIFSAWNGFVRPRPNMFEPGKSPYFGIDLAELADNKIGLNQAGIKVDGFDRQLGTLDVRIAVPDADGDLNLVPLVVRGSPIEDRNGYLKQIRGQRYEFVPANVVQLGGKETSMVFWVTGEGRIGRIAEGGFKHPVDLCPGLPIRYGDDIREKLEVFAATAGEKAYRDCEIVLNTSVNDNVLDEVVSLVHQVGFVTNAGRATQVNVWR